MSKKALILLTLWFFTSHLLIAQERSLTLEEAILGKYTTLAPQRLSQVNWVPSSPESFSHVAKDNLIIQSVKGDTIKIINLVELNDALDKVEMRTLNAFPRTEWLSETQLFCKTGKAQFIYDIKQASINEIIHFPSGAKNMDYTSEGEWLAYTIKNNLWITNGEKTLQVTQDTESGIVNGQTVHRNEFGISKGTFWSPNGNVLAFYRKDERMVNDYPLVNYIGPSATLKNTKYPMAGESSHHVTLGLFNTETQNTLFINTGKPAEQYLTNIAWGPKGRYIYIALLNREQNHMQYNQYDAETGAFVKTVIDEKDDKYVEPQFPLIFSTRNTDDFYYMSRKDGNFHVYKYNLKTLQEQQISSGNWEVTEILGFDEKENYLFLIGTNNNGLERSVVKINLRNRHFTRLEKEAGFHAAKLSPSGKFIIDTYENQITPRRTNIIQSNGKLALQLMQSSNPLAGITLGENRLFSIKSTDGTTDLNCRMILPPHFDPSKKYPVIVYVYGGPHAQLVQNRWQNSARYWQYYMADRGYIAFTLDNRGSANRGKEFEQVIHRNLGITETADQMAGIDFLKSKPFVDQDRIGVHGWSFGGFMTLNLMMRHPETFKVGVAGGPVVDWKLYEVMYGERYMDTPSENPDGYKESNMVNHIKNLDGNLLLIHGAMDKTVVMQHSMKFIRECIKQQKQVDFFTYPTAPHNVRGKDRLHLMKKVSDYFLEHL